MIFRSIPVICIFTVACSGNFEVFDAKGGAVDGMPFRASMLFIQHGEYTKHSKLPDCVATSFLKPVAMPTGAQYFVEMKSAPLAKTAFAVEYSPTGALSKFSMNSEPAGADVIEKATASAIDLAQAAGFVPGVAAPPTDKTTVDSGPKGPACNSGPKNVKYEKFQPGAVYLSSETN